MLTTSALLFSLYAFVDANDYEDVEEGPNSESDPDADAQHYLYHPYSQPRLPAPSPFLSQAKRPATSSQLVGLLSRLAASRQDPALATAATAATAAVAQPVSGVATVADPYYYEPYSYGHGGHGYVDKYHLFAHPSVVITTVALGGLILGGAATIIAAADRKALKLSIDRNERTLNRVESRTDSACAALNGIALVAAAPAGASTATLAATVNNIIAAANGNRCS